MPGHVFTWYIALLINVVSKTPLLLAAAPVFMYAGASLPPVRANHILRRLLIVVSVFIIAIAFFIVPSVYAQASLGPARQYTYLSFFMSLLAMYIFLILGNLRFFSNKGLFFMAVFSLLFYCSIYARDIYRQVPDMKKYALSEDSRLQKIAALKAADVKGIVILDSLYTPHYTSYSNLLRNEIKDKLQKHCGYKIPYESADFAPIFYNEISVDTAFYLNSDMAKTLHLPFAIKLKEK
jgi:uncharacterized membrane protein YobD (UPF0266 family)